MLLIVAGPHGYISPSWYAPGATPAPTWNFSVAHCYGVPQLLDAERNLAVLTRLVAHFEQHVEDPLYLDQEIRRAGRARDGRHPAADHPLHLQGQDERGQGPGHAARRCSSSCAATARTRPTALADDMERALRG